MNNAQTNGKASASLIEKADQRNRKMIYLSERLAAAKTPAMVEVYDRMLCAVRFRHAGWEKL